MRKSRTRIVLLMVVALLVVSGTVFGVLSATSNAEGTSGAKLVVLGVAGGPPFQNNHANTGFMLVVNGEQYLVDCGGGTPNNIAKAGYPYGPIHNVFFTHLHLDHYLGYTELIGRGPWAQGTPPLKSIKAWGPAGTVAMNNAATAFYTLGANLQNEPPIVPEAEDVAVAPGAIKVIYDDPNVKSDGHPCRSRSHACAARWFCHLRLSIRHSQRSGPGQVHRLLWRPGTRCPSELPLPRLSWLGDRSPARTRPGRDSPRARRHGLQGRSAESGQMDAH